MPKPATTPSGDFLAWFEDLKRKHTKSLTIGDKTFHVRGPAVFTDAEYAAVTDESLPIVERAKMMIDDYDGFAAAGGTAMALNLWYAEAFNDDPGESAASSTS